MHPAQAWAAPGQSGASLASSALRRREDAEAHFWVESLSALHLLGHLHVDAASMHALQIFQVSLSENAIHLVGSYPRLLEQTDLTPTLSAKR